MIRIIKWLRSWFTPNPVFELGLGAKTPTRGSRGAAGLDLYASQAIEISPGHTAIIATDLRCRFNYGWAACIWDRSGLGSKGFHRFAGLIDCDYDGKWGVVIHNTTPSSFIVYPGDRVAQVVFQRVWMGRPKQGLVDKTGRGGFGSTGR